jgi:adenosylcobyric acid synthase
MTKSLMCLGTHSSAGKSLLVTAFCRIFARKGINVAPFKAQNMSNNAGVTYEGGEMGRAQIVQAEAAGLYPHTDMNPVLLKPDSDRRSQIILNGKVYGYLRSADWARIRQELWLNVQQAYDRLASRHDLIILEGAGSPAEINLKQNDIVNLKMAEYAQAPCLLIGDIDRGGVFAALAGTLLLLEPAERAMIQGFIINKFRGDPALLTSGLEPFQKLAYGVPTLGIVPYLHGLKIADEDAATIVHTQKEKSEGDLDIVVIHLPHISNFDEFNVLGAEQGIHVRFAQSAEQIGHPQAIILPGTKATLADLNWLKEQGIDQTLCSLAKAGTAVVGICGGYQILGQTIFDPAGTEASPGAQAEGLGLLPAVTEFLAHKQTYLSRLQLSTGEILTGYEIHAGQTSALPGQAAPLGVLISQNNQPVELPEGLVTASGRIWGCYLHGIFENDSFRQRWLSSLGWDKNAQPFQALRQQEYDTLADQVEVNLDWLAVERIIGL